MSNNNTYTVILNDLSDEERAAIRDTQAAYVQRGTEIGAELEATEAMTPDEQRDLYLGDLRGLLFLVGVESMKRFLPEKVKNARRAAGESVTQFENRVNRLNWQLDMLTRLEDQQPGDVLGALADLASLEYAKYADTAEARSQMQNDALMAQSQIVQGAFRAACRLVMHYEKQADDREKQALIQSQRAANLADRNLGGGPQLGDLDSEGNPEEGATTAEPGRLMLSEDLSISQLLYRQPLGDQIESLDSLYARLMPYKASLENAIDWVSYTPKPMEYFSVRDPQDPSGGYLQAFSYAQARELHRQTEVDEEAKAAERRRANALARAALLK